MIITKFEFLGRAQLDESTLDLWIAEDWLVPQRVNDELAFTEEDLARVALIRELQDDMGVNAPGVDVLLSLVDQLHSLRRLVREILQAKSP